MRKTKLPEQTEAQPSGGEFLRAVRNQRGLTLRQLARQNDNRISSVYMSQIEKGRKSNFTLPTLIALAETYEVGVTDILNAYGVSVEGFEAIAPEALMIGRKIMRLSEADRQIVLNLIDMMHSEQPQEQY